MRSASPRLRSVAGFRTGAQAVEAPLRPPPTPSPATRPRPPLARASFALFLLLTLFLPLRLRLSTARRWDTLQYAANQAAPSGYSSGQDYVSAMFDKALDLGMTTYRIFIQGTGTGGVLKSDGSYDETLLVALDWLIDLANEKGVRLVITLNNLWKSDGVPLFEELCGTASDNFKPDPEIDPRTEETLNATERIQTPYSWFKSDTCREQYGAYMEAVFTRVNTVSGTQYLDDGAIFAWNILNEPRCKYCGDTVVGDWYKYAFKHARSVGVNQLLTTGEEGFFGGGNDYSSYDPNDGSLWAYYSGQHFQYDHTYADFAVIHIWPSNWAIGSSKVVSFTRDWIEQHADAADGLGKPLVIEEFGIGVDTAADISAVRDPMFSIAFGSVVGGSVAVSGVSAADISNTDAVQGALVWYWTGLTWRTTDNDILSTDSTMADIIAPYSAAWAAYAGDGNATAAASPRSTVSAPSPSAATSGAVSAQSIGSARPKAYPSLLTSAAPAPAASAATTAGRRLFSSDNNAYIAKSR